MSKHTPEPWEIVEGGVEGVNIKAGGQIIATVWPTDLGHKPIDHRANAGLLVSAPRLLRACEAAERELGACVQWAHKRQRGCPSEIESAWELCKEAIAQTKGGKGGKAD